MDDWVDGIRRYNPSLVSPVSPPSLFLQEGFVIPDAEEQEEF